MPCLPERKGSKTELHSSLLQRGFCFSNMGCAPFSWPQPWRVPPLGTPSTSAQRASVGENGNQDVKTEVNSQLCHEQTDPAKKQEKSSENIEVSAVTSCKESTTLELQSCQFSTKCPNPLGNLVRCLEPLMKPTPSALLCLVIQSP